MNSVKNMFKDIKNHDIILGIILIIYIFGGYQTPNEVAPIITNFMTYIILIIILGISFCNNNIIITFLLGISFLILLQRSHAAHPKNIMPSQTYRDEVMNNLNTNNTFNTFDNTTNTLNFPSSVISNNNSQNSKEQLEEYMVSNIATVKYRSEDLENITFKPTLSTSKNVFEIQ